MQVELTEEQAEALRSTLDQALGDLSSEIAATDNAGYRSALQSRRDSLRAVRSQLA